MVRRFVGILQLAMIALFALFVCSDLSASASTAQQGPATPVAGATPAMLATPASAAASSEPARCQVGLTVTALYGLNVTANTFDAEFWVWSVCPDNRYAPISTMEFFNASITRLSMESTAIVDGLRWTQTQVIGTFRHNWDLTDFPFDRQELKIEIEDAVSVAADFAYEPDATNPVYESDIQIDGWDIVDSDIAEVTHTYDTDFGHPNHPVGGNEFSRLIVTIAMERNDLTSFIKLTALVYIAFMIALIAFLIPPTDPSLLARRLAIISATLFTVGLSLRTATSDLGSEDGLTMVDGIHVAALVAILADAFTALAIWLLIKRGRRAADLERLNFVIMGVVLAGFVLANVWLIASAATTG